MALSVGSFLALIAILQTPAAPRPRARAVAPTCSPRWRRSTSATTSALLIPAQLALLLLFRERARLVIGCLALVAVLCVPLLVLAAERGSGQLFWVTPLSWRVAGQAALTLLSAGCHRTSTHLDDGGDSDRDRRGG